MHGDLGYVDIKPVDGPPFAVLVNKSGFWVMAGGDGAAEVDYSPQGNKGLSLREVVSAHSPAFAARFAAQLRSYRPAGFAAELLFAWLFACLSGLCCRSGVFFFIICLTVYSSYFSMY